MPFSIGIANSIGKFAYMAIDLLILRGKIVVNKQELAEVLVYFMFALYPGYKPIQINN